MIDFRSRVGSERAYRSNAGGREVAMFIRESRNLWRAFGLIAACLGVSSAASAQLYTADPYDPEGRGFRQYAYPGAGEGYPGSYAARQRGLVRPNQFERADDDLGFPSTTLRNRSSDLYHSFDREYGREYVPNEKADKRYMADRERREREMLRASLERDPKKREQMIREVEQNSRKASGDLSLSVRRSTTPGQAIPPAPVRSPRSGAAGRASSSAGVAIPPPPARRGASTTESTTTRAPAAPARRTPSAAAPASDRPNVPAAPLPSASSRYRDEEDPDPLPSDVLERARARDRDKRPIISTRRGS
jgi:hypothetical protein